jgi:hypothetical protein
MSSMNALWLSASLQGLYVVKDFRKAGGLI